MTGFATHNRHLAAASAAGHHRAGRLLPKGTMRNRVRNLRLNRQRRKLLAYDDHTLSDIGYDRAELARTAGRRRLTGMQRMVGNIHMQDMHPEVSYIRH